MRKLLKQVFQRFWLKHFLGFLTLLFSLCDFYNQDVMTDSWLDERKRCYKELIVVFRQ